MTHKEIYFRIRLAVVGAIICLAITYSLVTMFALEQAQLDYARIYTWLAVILVTILPCIAAGAYAWQISNCVKADRSFSADTARLLKKMSNCALADAAYFFVVNIVMGFLEWQHLGIVLISLVLILLALVIGVALAALARFVQKAADLQEESDLTI